MCCAGGVPFRVALIELVRRERPERVLVEPSGLGKVSALRAVLKELNGFELCSTICLIPADMHHRLWGNSEHYADQVYGADVLAVNRRDKVENSDDVASFVRDIYPPKLIAFIQMAEIDPDLLEARAVENDQASPFYASEEEDDARPAVPPSRFDRGDGSVRIESVRESRRLVGWIFDKKWTFDKNKLQALLSSSINEPLDRAKGVFRTNRGTLYAHWGCDGLLLDTQLVAEPAPAARSDSRAQMIFHRTNGRKAAPSLSPSLPAHMRQHQQPFSFSSFFGGEDEDAFLSAFEAGLGECKV